MVEAGESGSRMTQHQMLQYFLKKSFDIQVEKSKRANKPFARHVAKDVLEVRVIKVVLLL